MKIVYRKSNYFINYPFLKYVKFMFFRKGIWLITRIKNIRQMFHDLGFHVANKNVCKFMKEHKDWNSFTCSCGMCIHNNKIKQKFMKRIILSIAILLCMYSRYDFFDEMIWSSEPTYDFHTDTIWSPTDNY